MLKLWFLFVVGLSQSSYSAEDNKAFAGETRRILRGLEVHDSRPYMVYLRPAMTDSHLLDPNWLCGGVIVAERYILTSAACIEDINNFYVVAGTNKWVPGSETNECIENGAMRAVWKCIPRTYRFDGYSFNNILWMVHDIAVVQTEDSFNFYKRIKGCDYIPQKITYNNISKDLESPGTKTYIAGWGSNDSYTDSFMELGKTNVNSHYLMEATTLIIRKSFCKSYWSRRYHKIIDDHMICGKRFQGNDLSSQCEGSHAECRQLIFQYEVGPRRRMFEKNPDRLLLDSAAEVRKHEKLRKTNTRRSIHASSFGGFCENDHGGPLLIGQGRASMVIGIISAFKTENFTRKCYGPFLYTSIYDNRHLIHCALYKEIEGTPCSSVLRDVSTVLEEETLHWGVGTLPPKSYKYEDEDIPLIQRSNKVRNEYHGANQTRKGEGFSSTANTNERV